LIEIVQKLNKYNYKFYLSFITTCDKYVLLSVSIHYMKSAKIKKKMSAKAKLEDATYTSTGPNKSTADIQCTAHKTCHWLKV
jgi:hypothetical protein